VDEVELEVDRAPFVWGRGIATRPSRMARPRARHAGPHEDRLDDPGAERRVATGRKKLGFAVEREAMWGTRGPVMYSIGERHSA
jgi:hypothetical protein